MEGIRAGNDRPGAAHNVNTGHRDRESQFVYGRGDHFGVS